MILKIYYYPLLLVASSSFSPPAPSLPYFVLGVFVFPAGWEQSFPFNILPFNLFIFSFRRPGFQTTRVKMSLAAASGRHVAAASAL